MEKEDNRGFFNSQDGKVNIVLLFSIVLIFVIMVFSAEAITIKLISPGNLTYNGSRTINFTFNVTWTLDAEAATNCSVYINSSGSWVRVKINDSNADNGNPADDIVQNVTAGTSYMNYTIPTSHGDGNFSWNVGCIDKPLAGALNFGQLNNTFFLDTQAPTLTLDTPRGILADTTGYNITSYETATFYVNVSDNSTFNVWMILNSVAFVHSTIAPTGQNESANRSMTFSGVISTPDMRQYRFNVSPLLNFNSSFTSPGSHSVIFCANDSFARITCTNRSDFIIKGMNVTQMENIFTTMQQKDANGNPIGLAFGGLNITLGNGTEIPEGTFMNPVDGISLGGITHKNFTFIINISNNILIHIVAGRVDESQFANASNAKVNSTPSREIQQAVGTGFKATMAWADIASFIPSEVSYEYGILQLRDTGYSKRMYCNGTSVADPQCHSISQCNSSVFGIYNHTLAIPTNDGCWLESGTINGEALRSGFTYLFVDKFSGGLGGNDFSQINVTFNGPLFHNANTSVASRLINFTLDDINSTGLNLTLNFSINVTVFDTSWMNRTYNYINDSSTNLTCTTADTVSPQNTTSVTCNVAYAFSNGTYIIVVKARDTSNNSNPVNVTTNNISITVDQIPPVLVTINFSNTAEFGGLNKSLGASTTASIPAGGDGTWAQGRIFFVLSNWTDNLTRPFHAALQFYNVTSGNWTTLNATNDPGYKGVNISNSGTITNATVNFTFTPPRGHNEFEGRNVSFRLIVNDTLGNINTSMSVVNITIQINDTTKPTLSVSSVASQIHVNSTNTTDTTPTIVWNVTENNPLKYVAIEVDNAGPSGAECSKWVNKSSTVEDFRNSSVTITDTAACRLSNGTHTVRLTTEDRWGNSELYIHSFVIQTGEGTNIALGLIQSPTGGATDVSTVNQSNITPYNTLMFNVSFDVAPNTIKNMTWTSSCNSSLNTVTNATAFSPFNYTDCKNAEANRTVTLTATDYVGNTVTRLFQFAVDDVAPAVVVHSPTNGASITGITQLNVSAFDGMNRVHTIGYYLDGSNALSNHSMENATGITSSQGLNTSIMNRSINFTPGTHTLIISVNDTLGNVRNTSKITFVQLGPINFASLNLNSTLTIYNNNISFINLTNASGEPIYDLTTTVTDQTLNLFMALNATRKGINVTITFNASAANWDKYNFSVKQNDSKTIEHIANNWTAVLFDILWFNESIQNFLSDNNSYYASVKYPVNASHIGIGGKFEIWYFSDIRDLTTKKNVTECAAGFNPSFTFGVSAACWNNTNNESIQVYLPHFSVLAFTNNSNAPTANVSFPTSPNQTVSMFIPNITVSADAVTCKYQLNSSTPANTTMTKTGNVCLGQTERFKNLEAKPEYNITFWIIDDDDNTNGYVWGFNVTDNTPPNTPNSSKISSSVDSTSATVTIGTMNETVNATVYYATTIGGISGTGSQAVQTDFNQSQAVSLSGLTASTQYHFNVSICDYNGNCIKNGTFNLTTSAAAAAEAAAAAASSGGGGGAAAPSNIEASAGRQWDTLAAGSSGVLAVNNEKIAITGVTVYVKNAVTSPSITVESLTSNPLSVSAAAKVYQYLQLRKANIADSDASKITINFKVPKSWMTSNGVAESDIVLWRYSNNNWNRLDTKLVSSDGSFAIYEAVTPGFSTFAIGNKEGGTSAFAIIDMIRDFYAGTSKFTAFDIIDQIRSFYGG